MLSKTIIIAEAGVNHNGDVGLLKALIDIATEAGADYVKFQTFNANKLVSEGAKLAPYQKSGTTETSQLQMLSKLELSQEDHEVAITHCRERGIKFLSTAFDLDGLDYLASLNLDFFKIPSGEITNLPYLEKVASFGKSTILSTGMADMQEIQDALEIMLNKGLTRELITILHCNTQYPTPMHDVNLLAMSTIGNTLSVSVGYSDHTLGIEVPIAAVALGARVIEKHFTTDRTLEGPDHAASLEGHKLKQMVDAIRNIEEALKGDGVKKASPSELANKIVVRKSIHLREAKRSGEKIELKDLEMLRPGDGISPMNIYKILNKKVATDLEAGTKLLPRHLVG